MPAQFHDDVLDAALDVLNDATALHICEGAPTDHASTLANSLATVGIDSGDYTAPSDATPNGRELTVAAQNDVPVTSSGTPAYYCLVDATRLLARAEVVPWDPDTSSGSPDLTEGSTTSIPTVAFSVADPITT